MYEPSETILDRREDAVGLVVVDSAEKRFEVFPRHERNVVTEELDRGRFAECPSGALKGNAQRFVLLSRKMRRNSFGARLGCEILNSSGLVDDGPVEFYNCAIV